jgi:hypothetical protein
VDRQPWEIIDDSYYRHRLPNELRDLFQASREERGFWWPTLTSRRDAEQMLAYTRNQGQPAEVVGVFSPYLEHAIGRRSWIDDHACLIGIDVISIGEWSLLRALQEASVTLPRDIQPLLNDSCLLCDAAGATALVQYYCILAEQGIVEQIAEGESALGTEAVSIYVVGAK